MAGRIVLFGASGYTGTLVAEELARLEVPATLAGRNRDRLEELVARLGAGLDVAVADVSEPETVHRLVSRGDILISTVGPFARFGGPAVEAAVAQGADYLDSTGEPAFVREVFERHGPAATAAGVVLLTAFGYDFVPGHVAGALALEAGGAPAVGVDIGYFSHGGRFSGGTIASLLGASRAPQFAWRNGALVTERGGVRTMSFDLGSRSQDALSMGGSEHFGLRRSYPRLLNVGTYLGWFGPLTKAVQVAGAGQAALTRLPGMDTVLDKAAERLAPGSTGGPDAAERARSRSTVVAVARDRAGEELATVRLTGVDGYTLTARLLAWAALRLRDQPRPAPGARGPVEAFGLPVLARGLAEAGLKRARARPRNG